MAPLVNYLAGLVGLALAGTVIGAIVGVTLLIPVAVFAVAVFLVTYAELRYREDRSSTTRLLAVELSRDRVRQ
jgi:ABC-type phosphate transport system permease subunit